MAGNIRKRIEVNIQRQKLFAFEGDKQVFEFNCVTGRGGKPTHSGKHQILRKERFYTSKTYDAPMNYAMFFTSDGEAIHESFAVFARSYAMALGAENMVGPHIGSHGCVGLASDDAAQIFAWAPVHTPVEVS